MPTPLVTYLLYPGVENPTADANTSAIVLGQRFRTTVDGDILGVSFHKAAANTGTNTVSLWTNAGVSLATQTRAGDASSGWTDVLFASPVAITAGTTYVASYHKPAIGSYFRDANANISTVNEPPMILLGDGVDGVNGCFTQSATNVFPTSTFQHSTYWVDVIFSTPNFLNGFGYNPTRPAVQRVATI